MVAFLLGYLSGSSKVIGHNTPSPICYWKAKRYSIFGPISSCRLRKDLKCLLILKVLSRFI